jgi:hypothetical protein
MLINELAKAVHENAVAHGWWDDEREAPEIIALIHSEWSEALEEARADMPLAYITLKHNELSPVMTEIIPRGDDGTYTSEIGLSDGKRITDGKPEGVAVELIDGCIRILDYMGRLKAEIAEREGVPSTIESLYTDHNVTRVPDKLPELIAYLHMTTSLCLFDADGKKRQIICPSMYALLMALAAALSWVKKQGLDPLAILLEKHEFNKSRPYKHGKKF